MVVVKSHLSMNHDRERQWTRRVAIYQEYLDQVPMYKIAAKYGVCMGTVGKIAREFDAPKRKPGASPEVRTRVVVAYQTEEPIREIIARERIDRKTLWVIVKEAEIPLRQPRLKDRT